METAIQHALYEASTYTWILVKVERGGRIVDDLVNQVTGESLYDILREIVTRTTKESYNISIYALKNYEFHLYNRVVASVTWIKCNRPDGILNYDLGYHYKSGGYEF